MVSGVSSYHAFGRRMLGGVVVVRVAMGSRRLRPRKPLRLIARPRIVSEANKLKEGYWRKKTTRHGLVLATRQGTLESVWLWETGGCRRSVKGETTEARSTCTSVEGAARGAKPATVDAPPMTQRIATEYHMVEADSVSGLSAGDRAGVAIAGRLRSARHGRPHHGDDSW